MKTNTLTIQNNSNSPSIDWLESFDVSDYQACVEFMEKRVIDIRNGDANECIWLVEHTPLYTGGTSATESDLLKPSHPVHKSGRGGQYTYHGTGQRTVYIMLDLKKRGLGIKEYVTALEQWIIDALAHFNVKGERRCGRVGIWVDLGHGKEDKIAAIGVRVKKWVSYHGIAINISPDLANFFDIVPCGITESKFGVTSLEKLGILANLNDIDVALIKTFEKNFRINENS